MPQTPLERMYPNRCYDCLAVIGDTSKVVLCEACSSASFSPCETPTVTKRGR